MKSQALIDGLKEVERRLEACVRDVGAVDHVNTEGLRDILLAHCEATMHGMRLVIIALATDD